MFEISNVRENLRKDQSWSLDQDMSFLRFSSTFFNSFTYTHSVKLCSKFQVKILINAMNIEERTKFGPILIGPILLRGHP